MDESLFIKRKANVGRAKAHIWVFGMLERGTNRKQFMPVLNRRASTLLPLIERHISINAAVVCSDSWAS